MKNIEKHIWISEQFNDIKNIKKFKIYNGDWTTELGIITVEKINNTNYKIKVIRDDLKESNSTVYETSNNKLNSIIKKLSLRLKFC